MKSKNILLNNLWTLGIILIALTFGILIGQKLSFNLIKSGDFKSEGYFYAKPFNTSTFQPNYDLIDSIDKAQKQGFAKCRLILKDFDDTCSTSTPKDCDRKEAQYEILKNEYYKCMERYER